MSLGRIFSPRAVDNVSSKSSDHTESSIASAEERFEERSKAQNSVDLRSAVQRRFMSMMEAHDRVRARVLGSSPTSSYPVSGD